MALSYKEKRERGFIEFRPTGPNTLVMYEANFCPDSAERLADNVTQMSLDTLAQNIEKLEEKAAGLKALIADARMGYDDAKAAIEKEFPPEKAKK